jgi:antirestriction protein ArdC
MRAEDIFQKVTDQIVHTIETGAEGTWTKPWQSVIAGGGIGINAQTRQAYKGMNQLILMVETAGSGYELNVWATYKQWTALGGQVRKGEHGTLLVKWGKTYHCDACSFKGRVPCQIAGHTSQVSMWASPFYVFNVAQQDGVTFELPELGDEPTRLANVEAFVVGTGAAIFHQAGDEASYSPLTDSITLPLREQFSSPAGYYGTALHELTHWAGGSKRLARTKGVRFGDDEYAAEELVAELGSTFLAATFGIEVEPHADHAAYLASWLKVLKADSRALYRAAKAAQDSVEYLTELAGVEVSV